MTLLVDVDTELHDVEKAHLNFARPDEQAEQTADPPSALQSNMPCLRKLVKPTDWEKVRSSVVRYVDKALRDPTIPPQTLSKMTVKLPGHGGWLLVEEATVHQIPGSKKIWLLLNGFRPEKARLDWSSLQGWMSSLMQAKTPVDVLKDGRVEEEMMKLRQRNYQLFSRCLGCKGAALLAVGLRQNDFLLDLDLRRNAGLPG
eukprot:g16809.t1